MRRRRFMQSSLVTMSGLLLAACDTSTTPNDGRSWMMPEEGQPHKRTWMAFEASGDITDGHTDFYARFAGPGVVVAGLDNDPDSFDYDITRRHLDILRAAIDAHSRPLQVETLEGPSVLRVKDAGADFAAGYINFYVCNGAVIAPEFGDPDTDPATQRTLARLFPGREVVQINIDAIAAGGGGIHCTTQQEPAEF